MGAEQSADTTLPGKLQSAARRAFFKEHGRDPTEEEEARFTTAFDRNDPTDDHLGAVTAEEADACREIARLSFNENHELTDDELSERTDTLARCMRRAALEAVEPDVEAVRRELVRRAVEAEKASGDAAAPSRVAFGPPPRPADEGAAAGPAEIFEREARAEHEKVRVVAAAAHAVWSSTDCDSKTVKGGLDNLISVANSDDAWDDKVRFQGAIIAKLRTATLELHMAAADHTIAEATTARDRTYATTLQDIARGVYELENCSGGNLDYPSLSSEDAADMGLRYESVPWEDLEAYDQDMFDSLIKAARTAQRVDIIHQIRTAALAKRERDAAAELKEREAQSRAADVCRAAVTSRLRLFH